jgi:hypothetical protein
MTPEQLLPWEWHQIIFQRRHFCEPALFHEELVSLFWSKALQVGVFAFRGSGKSTLAEEFVALQAARGLFRNCLIVGASEARAAERLAAIAREFEHNEDLTEMFGEQRGDVWTQTKIVLRNGACVQALGKDQSVRGVKHLDWRPDLVVVDDFESPTDVNTPAQRGKTFTWFLAELLPACQPGCKVRVLATPQDPDSVPMRLSKTSSWIWRTYPVVRRRPETGEEEATWPALFPLDLILQMRQEYGAAGEPALFDREYMCEAVSAGERVFCEEHIRIEPRVRTWEPTWVMVDPARTTRRETSAMTGVVVWSWIGNELVVWEDRTGFYRPDEVIAVMFELDERYRPVFIGIEENGLEQWLAHAIVQEMTRRSTYLPVKAMRAPRDKLNFIAGLQPFLTTGALVLRKTCPSCVGSCSASRAAGLTGRTRWPTLPLRPGIPVYGDFNPNVHVADRVFRMAGEPFFLAMNSDRRVTVGARMQVTANRTMVMGDWVREGAPAIAAPEIVRAAALFAAGPPLEIKMPPSHADTWNNVGLLQAVKSCAPTQVGIGLDPRKGREYLRKKLNEMPRGPAAAASVQIDSGARYTLAAIAAGYAQPHGKPEPEPGVHRLLMEAVESVLALCAAGLGHSEAVYSYTADGRRYMRYATAADLGRPAPQRLRNPNYPLP